MKNIYLYVISFLLCSPILLYLGCNGDFADKNAGYKVDPVQVSLSYAGVTEAEVTWEKARGATGYVVSLWSDENQDHPVDKYHYLKVDSSVNRYVFKSLTGGVTYYAAVKSIMSFGISQYSSLVRADMQLPFPRTAILEVKSSTSLILNWDAISGIGSYNYLLSLDKDFSSLVVGATTYDKPVVIKNLQPNTRYYAKVQSIRGGRASSFGNPGEGVTDYAEIEIRTPINITQSSASISWKAVPNVGTYEVLYSASPDFKDARTVSSTSLGVELTNLEKNTTYWVKFRCFSFQRYSKYSEVVSFTTKSDKGIDKVPPPTVFDVTGNSFKIKWDFIPGYDGYEISISKTKDFKNLTSPYDNFFTSSSEREILNLRSGTTYFVKLRGKKDDLRSPYSDIVEVQTLEYLYPPTIQDAKNITSYSFDISWTATLDASYRIDVSESPDFGTKVSGYDNLLVTKNTHTITGLHFNTTYYIRVKTTKGVAISDYSLSKEITTAPPVAPPIPTVFTAKDTSESGFTLDWAAVSGASEYELEISRYNTFSPTEAGYGPKKISFTSEVVSSLVANTTYYCRIRAKRHGLVSKSWSSIEVPTLLLPPILNTHSDIKSGSFVAHWVKVAGVDHYVLQVSDKEDFSTFASGYTHKIIPQSENEHLVIDLLPVTKYYYRMKSVKGSLNSNYSKVSSLNTKALPAPTTALPAYSITNNGFVASWKPSGAALSYRIDIATDAAFKNYLSSYEDLKISSALNILSVSGLTAGKDYFYRVRVETSDGTSINSNVISLKTIDAIPASPNATRASSITSGSFQATWDPYPNTKSYRIDVATDGSFLGLVTGYTSRNVGNVVFVDISGLSPNTTYYYRIRAELNTGKTSANSNIQSVTTSPLSSPTLNAATSIKSDSFYISWSSVPGAVTYRVEVSESSLFASLTTGYPKDITGTDHTVTGLSPNKTYYYRVSSQQKSGGTITYTTPSASKNATTNRITAPTPTATTATSIGYDVFTANFTTASLGEYSLDVAKNNTFSDRVSGYPKKISVTTEVVDNLEPGVTYYYRVRVDNSTTVSSWSNTETVATTTLGIPVITVDDNRHDELDLSWGAVTDAGSYELEVSTTSAFTSKFSTYTPKEIIATSHSITGLSPDTEYYFRIRSVHSTKSTIKSSYSRTFSARTTKIPFSITSTAISPSGVVGGSTLNADNLANDGSYTGSLGCGVAGTNKNQMIPISIINPPTGTTHYAITISEKIGATTSYLLGTHSIPSTGVTTIDQVTLGATGAVNLVNDHTVTGYSGPCPRTTDNVEYVIKLYALNTNITTTFASIGLLINDLGRKPLSDNVLQTAEIRFILNKK